MGKRKFTGVSFGWGLDAVTASGTLVNFRFSEPAVMRHDSITTLFCDRYCGEWKDNEAWCLSACPLRLYDKVCEMLRGGSPVERVVETLDERMQNQYKLTVHDGIREKTDGRGSL